MASFKDFSFNDILYTEL